MNVIFTPATAKGYSHNALSPFFLQRSSWKDFCRKRAHWAELGAQFENIQFNVVVVTGFWIVFFSDYIVQSSFQGLQDELWILSLFNEIINESLAVQLPQEVWRLKAEFQWKSKVHGNYKSFRSFRVRPQWIAIMLHQRHNPALQKYWDECEQAVGSSNLYSLDSS